MKKITITLMIFFIFLSVIFISGCTGGGSSSSKVGDEAAKQDASTRNPYIGGTEALSIKFYELLDYIPKDIVFPVLITIENKGEYTIPQNHFRVILLSADLWGKQGNSIISNSEEVKGREKIGEQTTPGGKVVLGFQNCKYQGVQELAIPPSSIRVQYCYPYKTYSTTDFCVLSNNDYQQVLMGKDSYCMPTGTKKIYNSGAPIRLKKVEQFYSSPGSIILSFTVEKVNNIGTVYYASPGQCSGDIDKIMLEDISTSDPRITISCGGKGLPVDINLLDNEGEIICNLHNVPSANSYIEKLDITLGYMYRDVITESVQVFTEKS